MDNDPNGDSGYLSSYGVVVIPPPTAGDGGWCVSLTAWNPDGEVYATSGTGPIYETRDEALSEANRVLDWIAEHGDQDDLMRLWEGMQQARTAGEPWKLPTRGSWTWW